MSYISMLYITNISINIMARISYNDKTNIINNVIQLKTEFNRAPSFHHVQVYHDNGWYIYKVDDHNYEVFKENIIQTVEYVDGKIKAADLYKVKYPDDEDFGVWAWSVNSYDRALDIIKYKS